MQRFLIAGLAALALTAACKVERTPEEYFDHADRIAVEREDSEEELRDRIFALGQAIARGNPGEAMIALAPAANVSITTPEQDVVLTGPAAVRLVLRRLASTPVAVAVRSVDVTVGPAGQIAWFRAEVDAPGSAPEGTRLRVTGVYLRSEGAWELVQAHVSTPRLPEYPPADSVEALPEA